MNTNDQHRLDLFLNPRERTTEPSRLHFLYVTCWLMGAQIVAYTGAILWGVFPVGSELAANSVTIATCVLCAACGLVAARRGKIQRRIVVKILPSRDPDDAWKLYRTFNVWVPIRQGALCFFACCMAVLIITMMIPIG